MATITGLTAERMLTIEANSVVSGAVVVNDLILTKQNGATINAGNVRGPTGSPGVTTLELSTQFGVAAPIGMIVDFIGTTAPTNFLAMTGQTIVSGQTTYAALWALLPISMKSGSSIVMPDTRGRVSVGHNTADVDFETVGKIGGFKTHILQPAEIPTHTHTTPNHTHNVNAHQHSIDHDHPVATSSGQSASHSHGGAGTGEVMFRDGTYFSGYGVPFNATGVAMVYSALGLASNDHSHTVDVPYFSGLSGPAGSTTDSNGASVTGSAGAGSAHNNVQPYVVFMKVIKAL